eukprot:TRINITY_DN196_c0_g1_i1.p1 TRINITY_DN196_c0_g1~~TRINITY_DN196_c0_g1_i1.p1  ORF type:complete len:943 (+),score=171.62 TRINITY_DN196_c0_g1_i1:378-2831(+)
MSRIRNNNQPVIPEDSIQGFPDADSVTEYLFENLNTTQSAVNFYFETVNSTNYLRYSLQVNETNFYVHGQLNIYTTYVELPLVVAVNRAILQSIVNDSSLQFNVSAVEYPHEEVNDFSIISDAGPLFFFGAIMFNVVACLNMMVTEKELKLRMFLKLMGLMDSPFWVSWFFTQLLYTTATVLVLIISGLIFQMRFFLVNPFPLYFLLLWLFAISMISATFVISTIVKKARNATTIGFLVFVLGFIGQIIGVVVYTGSQILQTIFSLFSPIPFAKGLMDLALFSFRESSDGMAYDEVDSYTDDTPLLHIYFYLIADFFIYLVIALYLDNVLPNEYGVRKSFYFFLTPGYWFPGQKLLRCPWQKKKRVYSRRRFDEESTNDGRDVDVVTEERDLQQTDTGQLDDSSVYFMGLSKRFEKHVGREAGGKGCCRPMFFRNRACTCCTPLICGERKEKKFSVDDLWVELAHNQCFCLLGHNGAGKTTTISMATGLLPPTAGTVRVLGYDLINDLAKIQSLMGVCPQFDVQWPDLTGSEHLWIFAAMKGSLQKRKDRKAEVARLLKKVSLTSASNRQSRAYSGGMKRRLSVAMALIGDPSIVFLDEPTSGMDPISRREVWNVIEESKKDRVLILTTHSMEEADILGDRIAIMAKGRLRCIGSSLHLKNKFGAGYTITVGVEKGHDRDVLKFFDKRLGSDVSADGEAVGGYLLFKISRNAVDAMPDFLAELEKASKDLGIFDVQLSLTTLEEVFLAVAKDVHDEEEGHTTEGSSGHGVHVEYDDTSSESESSDAEDDESAANIEDASPSGTSSDRDSSASSSSEA